MGILTPQELDFAETIRAISFVNPFLPERVDLERHGLGGEYVEVGAAKGFEPGAGPNPNMAPLIAKAEALLAHLQREAKLPGAKPSAKDHGAAGDLALFALYHRHIDGLGKLAWAAAEPRETSRFEVPWFGDFQADAKQLLVLGSKRLRPEEDAPKLLGLFFQMARAFVNIYANFVGRSPAAVALRACMWESIFTHDLGRYRRTLLASKITPGGHSLMADIPTLITGPSGTGKELVAQAVGRSGFTPFNEAKRCFVLDPAAHFLPIHLAALSPSLIESELFGHRRGAFTGALEDRASFLETCASYGTVFLDEIAEIDETLQVKLLRVLQTREFCRTGDSERRHFQGRVVSATNRDLAKEIEAGRFREDLYFRINADRLETPGLMFLLNGSSAELEHLVGFVAAKLLPGAEENHPEAQLFASELCSWIEKKLGLDYAWPGNFRELEQCARAVLIRGKYKPESGRLRGESMGFAELAASGQLTADELLNAYCALVYGEVGTYEGTARRLGLDRRTVKARVNAAKASRES